MGFFGPPDSESDIIHARSLVLWFQLFHPDVKYSLFLTCLYDIVIILFIQLTILFHYSTIALHLGSARSFLSRTILSHRLSEQGCPVL